MSRHQSFWNAVWYLLALKSFTERSILTLIFPFAKCHTFFGIIIISLRSSPLLFYSGQSRDIKKNMTSDDTSSSPFCLFTHGSNENCSSHFAFIEMHIKNVDRFVGHNGKRKTHKSLCTPKNASTEMCARDNRGRGLDDWLAFGNPSRTTVVYLHSNETHGAHVEWQRCPAGILIQRSVTKKYIIAGSAREESKYVTSCRADRIYMLHTA